MFIHSSIHSSIHLMHPCINSSFHHPPSVHPSLHPPTKFLLALRPFCTWWGDYRIDYQLEVPAGLEQCETLPNAAYAHIVQTRYWEAKEMISFVLRQVSDSTNTFIPFSIIHSSILPSIHSSIYRSIDPSIDPSIH